jgi:soluble lytic murein transglycosylase-like protein
VVVGVVLGIYSTSVPGFFAPPAGPPDTLGVLGVPLPNAAPRVPTRNLERVLLRRSPSEVAVAEFSARYRITAPLSRMIYKAATEHGVDPELAFRLIRVESVFDADAVGSAGATGLMQLMPGTARTIDPAVDSRKELLEPRTNLRLGLTNLREMIELFEGDVRLGVIAYNRGPVAVSRAVKRGADPENGYGELVLGARAHGGRAYSGPGLISDRPTP